MEQLNFSFGYIPDTIDVRDFKFAAPALEYYPSTVDLRTLLQPIKNQGTLGACTAFATTALVEYVRNKQELIEWDASPLFTYYSTRKIENTIEQDSGAYVRDALKSAAVDGVAKETTWPYIIENFTINPPTSAWDEAQQHQALVYYRLNQTKEDVISCLADGYPFVFGVKLYQSFIDTQCGIFVNNVVPLPNTTTERLLGGHCMLAVGYVSSADTNINIITRNSWGVGVGLDGYHNIPLEYFLDPTLCLDMWTIRKEEIANDVKVVPTPVPITPPSPIEPTLPIVPPEPVQPSHKSVWQQPATYIIIGFIILLILFATL